MTGQAPARLVYRALFHQHRAAGAETGQFDWISDAYDDDLPHWMEFGARDQLILPYTLEANDMRFRDRAGLGHGRDFEDYLIDAFDTLYAEGQAGAPKMLSIGLHCRLVGRPGKIAGLMRFLDHAMAHDGVWFATRGEIAATIGRAAPAHTFAANAPLSAMDRDSFVAKFGGIYEHSPWVAEAAHALGTGPRA